VSFLQWTHPPATLHPLPGEHSCVEPPDPIPNSEVKRARADGSVHPHARVGHRQGLTPKPRPNRSGFFFASTKFTLAHPNPCSPRKSGMPSGMCAERARPKRDAFQERDAFRVGEATLGMAYRRSPSSSVRAYRRSASSSRSSALPASSSEGWDFSQSSRCSIDCWWSFPMQPRKSASRPA
jgi:hypothetical protein